MPPTYEDAGHASPCHDDPGASVSNAGLGPVMAVVVTYNPDASLRRNLEALRMQIETVVVIDNGSANIEFVEQQAQAAGCEMVANRTNQGIAAALNQAVILARAGGFTGLATFDQDSLIRPGVIAQMTAFYGKFPHRDRIGVLAMAHRDATGRDYHLPWDILEDAPTFRLVRTTITSGNIIPIDVFETVGAFDEALFIDSVDHDFCLRCRSHGLLVVEGKLQVMDHAKGQSKEHRFFWLRVPVSNHSPPRRYYITRNQLELCRRYLFVDFVWVCAAGLLLLCEAVFVLLYEQERRAKFNAMIEGARDFLLRRFGPRQAARTLISGRG